MQVSATANILIGDVGVAGENGIIHIGTKNVHTNTFIAGIADQIITATPSSAVATVCVNTGSAPSAFFGVLQREYQTNG